MRNRVTELLLENKIKPNLKGFKYLRELIVNVYENPNIHNYSIIYNNISNTYGESIEVIESSMTYAIRKASIKLTLKEFVSISVLKLIGEE